MEILKIISSYSTSKAMLFVLIGGQAYNAHGFSRQTGDLDLLVQLSDKQKWVDTLTELNYESAQLDDRFGRFRSKDIAAWPIDLMFVDYNTFQKIYADSLDIEVGNLSTKVISKKHLAILKIHALKHYQEHRYLKDYTDLVSLLKSKDGNIDPQELKTYCLKYASIELYDKITRDLK